MVEQHTWKVETRYRSSPAEPWQMDCSAVKRPKSYCARWTSRCQWLIYTGVRKACEALLG